MSHWTWSCSLVGPAAITSLRDMFMDKLLFSVSGIDASDWGNNERIEKPHLRAMQTGQQVIAWRIRQATAWSLRRDFCVCPIEEGRARHPMRDSADVLSSAQGVGQSHSRLMRLARSKPSAGGPPGTWAAVCSRDAREMTDPGERKKRQVQLCGCIGLPVRESRASEKHAGGGERRMSGIQGETVTRG